jgi:hypothetical protein
MFPYFYKKKQILSRCALWDVAKHTVTNFVSLRKQWCRSYRVAALASKSTKERSQTAEATVVSVSLCSAVSNGENGTLSSEGLAKLLLYRTRVAMTTAVAALLIGLW